MKIKYSDLKKVCEKLDKHSQKGDIDVTIDQALHSLIFTYLSNVGTETVLQLGESELNRFVTVTEKKWLND